MTTLYVKLIRQQPYSPLKSALIVGFPQHFNDIIMKLKQQRISSIFGVL